ncbi:NADPH-dependent FMN reductase [Paenibacillus nasutitermitis]|uniref:NAD(P)H-dependent FMN reductase n=1 Tax=Paenibacillus nasutitermitis TaxID=1652958 RepID=A0A916YYQ8_9BACL|nr:NADPH-dependent FMN reductase [Paenibacillus nasutitermitis]GGD67387.1 NAD(P)H-dependent FMN reductase [Paenibacillus nasutitermitis]
MTQIVIVSGSTNKSSRLYGLIQYSQPKLEEWGYEIKTIHVADLPAEDLIGANFNSPQIIEALSWIEQADAVIIGSPVYKASYTGVLKTFLDLIPMKGLRDKITLPFFIGGSIAHLLAIDYALKPVIAALGGHHILGGVYAVDQAISRFDNHVFEVSEEIRNRLDDALGQLNEELQWRKTRSKEISPG